MSSNTHQWPLCRNTTDLLLPNELLHKILLTVISDSVHSICVSPGDTTWEKSMMDTFHQVSPAFKAISTELVAKAFDISKIICADDASFLRTIRKIFIYLSHLGMRLRHPSDWGSISFQTIDCSASSFVFGYALYLSCISLRRNASRSPRDVFNSTHKVIISALTQSEALCSTRVFPKGMTLRLRQGIQEEFELTKHGMLLVDQFSDLERYKDLISLRILPPASVPYQDLQRMIHESLCHIEGVYKLYTSSLANRAEPEAPIHELPGVLPSLRKLSTLTIRGGDEYNLTARIAVIVAEMAKACPFLNGEALQQP